MSSDSVNDGFDEDNTDGSCGPLPDNKPDASATLSTLTGGRYDTSVMRRAPLEGKFIVLDGCEGCGKSTQSKLLVERLQTEGVHPLLVHDPGTTRIGNLVRQILLNPDNTDMGMRCEMLLYMAARAQMMSELILPALDDGRTVVSDRFVSSTLAYQLGGDGPTMSDIRQVAQVAITGRWPDLTIILDLPIEVSSQRVQPKYLLPFPEKFKPQRAKDRIEQRSLEYHDQVRKNYLAQAQSDPQRYRVIDATHDVQAVHEEIWKHVHKLSSEKSK